MFYFNKKYELILPFSETVERSKKHPSYNEQFNGTFFFEERTTTETPPNSALCSVLESISYLHDHFQLLIFSVRLEPFSIQDVCQIPIVEDHLSVKFEQVHNSVISSAAFIIDMTNLDEIDNTKSND